MTHHYADGPLADELETDALKGAGKSDAQVFLVRVEPVNGGVELRIDERSPGPHFVGKSQSASMRLEDPAVSRRHLSLALVDGRLRLRDLGSKNGTFIGGVRVVEALLQGGERVEIGATRLGVRRLTEQLPEQPPSDTNFGQLFGSSTAMRRLFPMFRRLAQASIPVVIEGETGTGKEVLAEALHTEGPRASGAFVVLDCTRSASSSLENELFGAEAPSLAANAVARDGLFREAQGGTLLLDEVADLDYSLQSRLLRTIERMESRPLGGGPAAPVDVRLIATTRRDLDREVAEGRFRDELFHRLCVARVTLPPLRERRDDIIPLARRFYAQFVENLPGHGTEPPAELLQSFRREPWPGNVRQLRNAVARAIALEGVDPAVAPGVPDSERPGPDLVAQILAERLPLPVARARIVHAFERAYLEEVLRRYQGKVTRAAKESGVALRYFQLLRQRRSES